MPKAKKKKVIIKKKKVAVKTRKKILPAPKIKKAVKKPAVVKKPVVKRVVKKKAKPAKPAVTTYAAEALFKARIKVMGIGGGGGSIVSEIGRSLEKATFVIADTDARSIKKRPGIKYFLFGQDLTHGLGTGVNVELGKQAAEGAKEKIISTFKDQDIVIFIASLGGGLGSGATQVFAEEARKFGGITLGIFTLPFKFEGKNKHRVALNALKTLRQSLNVSLVIPNERIFKIIDANTPITQAFSTVNKSLIESLESLIDLIYSPGIINIDFADLRAILQGRGNSAFLNTVEESGKDRADKICQKALVNPLLQKTGFTAEKILFNISGSDNLSMYEVEKISSHIANSNPKAKIIFGISKNPKLKNKIKTTILMTGGQIEEDFAPEKPEPVKDVLPEPEKKEVKTVKETQPAKKSVKPEKKIAKAKKPVKKQKKQEKEPGGGEASFVPVFQPQVATKAVEISEISLEPEKRTIRRSAMEIKKAEEMQEKKRIEQEKEWEIPAFLRRVKYNK